MEDSLSISLSLSKGTAAEEMSLSIASLGEAAQRIQDSISNEKICRGDVILETYEVTSDAITGGMGSVWKVYHRDWDTDLAMKRPKPRFFAEGSEQRKEEFIRECENWINLGLHPHIVSCYYVRELGGVPAIFSEWMDRGSLKNCIRDGSLYEGGEDDVAARILDIAIRSERGLRYSHDNDLIHQDVKPGNLLLSEDWNVKVADFGLAKARSSWSDDVTLQITGYTPEYCPKEQTEGAAPAKWMDVYAWALTVLEMYAGKRLWPDGAAAAEHLEEYFPVCRVAVPECVRSLLTAALTETPEDFSAIEGALTAAYRTLTGRPYPLKETRSVSDTAAALNNRALSFLDLKKKEEAEALWQRALVIDQNCIDALYNRELYLMREQRKYDFQAIDTIYLNKAAKEESAALPIYREWDKSRPPFPEPDEYRHDGKATSAVTAGDHICFSVNDYADKGEARPFLLRAKVNSPETEKPDYFEAVSAYGTEVRKIVLHPDGETAVLLLRDYTACVYDIRRRAVLTRTEPLPVGRMRKLFKAMNEFQGVFSKDGHYLVLCEGGSSEGVLVLEYPSFRVLADGDMKFVCFTKEGQVLLRSKEDVDETRFPYLGESSYKAQQAFFLSLGEDGQMREVCRFDACRTHLMHAADANEWNIEAAPVFFYRWGWDSEENQISSFWLDERFEKKKITSRLFGHESAYSSVLYYDPAEHLLFTRLSHSDSHYPYAVWDMDSQKCLYTVKNEISGTGAFVPMYVAFDAGSRELITWKNNIWDSRKTFSWSSRGPLPAAIPGERAPWRISRIVTVAARIEEEEMIHALYTKFRDLYQEGRYADALAVFRKCRDIPGFAVSEEGSRMETAIDAVAEKTELRKIGRIDDLPDWPEYLTQSGLQPDGSIVKAGGDREGNAVNVRFFRRDGKLLRTLILRGITGSAAVRSGKIIVFKGLAYRIYDFEGNLLDASDRKHAFLKDGQAASVEGKYLDLDLTGTCLLYGVDVRRHARGDESLAGIFQKNLVTGEIIRMGDFIYNLDAYQGYGYQKDGTILVRKGAQLARKRKEDGKLLKTYRLGNAPEHRIIVRFNNERDKAFVTCDIDKFRSNWFGFRMDGTIFFKEKNTKFSRLATCFGGRFIALSKSEEFQIRDIEKNEVVYSEETRSNHDISMRPDGREFFTRLDWKLPVHAYRLEYEYELPEEGRISAPSTILRMLNDEEEEGIVTEVRVEDWDREPEIDADKVSTIENDGASKGGTDQAAETSETEKTQKKEGFFARLFRVKRP